MRRAWLGLLVLAGSAAAEPPSFFSAVQAQQAGDHPRCAGLLLAMEADRLPMPQGGEVLVVECLSAAARRGEAFDYLRRQFAGGRVPLQRLRDSQDPGIAALRADARWPGFLTEAETVQARFEAGLDMDLRRHLL